MDLQRFVQGQAITSDQLTQVCMAGYGLASNLLCESREAVWATGGKVPFKVVYTRRGAPDEVLFRHTNLWVLTCKQDRWAVALRAYRLAG